MNFKGKCAVKLMYGLPKVEPSRNVSYYRSVWSTSTCKNRGSMDQGSMFCTFPPSPHPGRLLRSRFLECVCMRDIPKTAAEETTNPGGDSSSASYLPLKILMFAIPHPSEFQ